MHKPTNDTSTSLELALIQKRCAELLESPDNELEELSLEDSEERPGTARDYFIRR